ncbi:hypothetical protein L204_104360 [Cryptococcus depauperatus]|nr:hypothetical protein L204_04810 [Cryptococcus depauperatus CBS 7855]
MKSTLDSNGHEIRAKASNTLQDATLNQENGAAYHSSPTRSPSRRLILTQTRSSISADPERPQPSKPPSPPPPEANAPPPSQEVTHLRLAAHYAGLVLASMLGCIARLGLNALGTYDGMIIFPLAWSQGVGSGIMGLALSKKNDIVAIYPPIYTFLTTGIAGSITTFSSWMLDGYLSFSNFEQYGRKGLHDTMDGVAYSLVTFGVAMSSLIFGQHLGSLLPSVSQRLSRTLPATEEKPTPSSPASSSLRFRASQTPILDIITISTALIAYLIALLLYFLAPKAWRHDAVFALLLSPPGAILRFALSTVNTRRPFIDRFPLGTFTSNMAATLIVAGTFVAQRRPGSSTSATKCNALYAVQQGFCGCLSTVSTFVVEARTVKGWKSKWFYIGGSVVLGHVFVLAVVGGTKWTRGFVDVCIA